MSGVILFSEKSKLFKHRKVKAICSLGPVKFSLDNYIMVQWYLSLDK